jgi:hypothetical protein
MFFSFVGGFRLPRGCTGLCFQGVVGESHVVCDAHLFILPIHAQAGLKPVVVGRNGANFSQCSIVWGSFPLAKGSGCCGV